MGRNNVQKYRGKSLAQWQQQITENCKDAGRRRCLQNDDHDTLEQKILRNLNCLEARSAVQAFYDDDVDDEISQTHQAEIAKENKIMDDCFRFLQQWFSSQKNSLNKLMAEIERERAAENRAPKPGSGPTPVKTVSPTLKALMAAITDPALGKLFNPKTGSVDVAGLKRAQTALSAGEHKLAALKSRRPTAR